MTQIISNDLLTASRQLLKNKQKNVETSIIKAMQQITSKKLKKFDISDYVTNID